MYDISDLKLNQKLRIDEALDIIEGLQLDLYKDTGYIVVNRSDIINLMNKKAGYQEGYIYND